MANQSSHGASGQTESPHASVTGRQWYGSRLGYDDSMPGPLPADIRRLFWELPRDGAILLSDVDIYAKVCEHGSVDDCRWLLSTAGRERLTTWFTTDALRHLSPRSLRFWACLLECPVPGGRPQVPWVHD